MIATTVTAANNATRSKTVLGKFGFELGVIHGPIVGRALGGRCAGRTAHGGSYRSSVFGGFLIGESLRCLVEALHCLLKRSLRAMQRVLILIAIVERGPQFGVSR